LSSPSERDWPRIGEYEILFELASGGMATILLARQAGDAGFERLVALKRIHKHLIGDPEVFAMASDEARFAALVRHPNVVPVIGVLDAHGELVLVQEYVEGTSAASLLKRVKQRGERLELNIASRILCDALSGLHAAHEAKDLRGEALELVHRDVSPQNLMVGTDGITRLIDFGIARAEERMAKTRTGIVKGKIHYMAPEQIEERPLDRRADLFAAAAVMVELVTGERPFGTGSDAAVMGRILIGDAELDELTELSPDLAAVLRPALASDPDARPKTALELKKAIAAAVSPAETEEVQALVERMIGADLEALRLKIRSSLGALENDEVDVPAPAANDSSQPSRFKRWWLLPVAAAFALLVAAAVSLGDPPRDREVGATATAEASLSIATASAASSLPMAAGARSTEPSTIPKSAAVEPSGSPAKTVQQNPPASPSAKPSVSSGLMPSPYSPRP